MYTLQSSRIIFTNRSTFQPDAESGKYIAYLGFYFLIAVFVTGYLFPCLVYITGTEPDSVISTSLDTYIS